MQVYYNPDNTVLRGRPETWLRGGWNRWTHARAFPPQPMQPVTPGGTGFLQSTVQVCGYISWFMVDVMADGTTSHAEHGDHVVQRLWVAQAAVSGCTRATVY